MRIASLTMRHDNSVLIHH